MGNCKGLHGEVMTDVLFFQAVASTLLAQGLPEGCKIVFHSLKSLYTLADRQCPPPPFFTRNSWFMSGPGHLCSLAGMQRISKTPLLCLSHPHANKWSRRLPGQMKAHQCSHSGAGRENVRNGRGKKRDPFGSVSLPVFLGFSDLIYQLTFILR